METNVFNPLPFHNPADPINQVSAEKTIKDFLYHHDDEDDDILQMLEMFWQSYLRTQFFALEHASKHYDSYHDLCRLIIRLKNLQNDPRYCTSERKKEQMMKEAGNKDDGPGLMLGIENICDLMSSIVSREEKSSELMEVYDKLNHYKLSIIRLGHIFHESEI